MKGLTAVALAFLIAWIGVPMTARLSNRIGAVDVPKDWRRMHKRSIPRGGGIVIFFAVVTAWIVLLPHTSVMIAAMEGGLLLFAVGLADDIWSLDAIFKLSVQIFAATLAVAELGAFEGIFFLLAVLWVVTLANAHNFVDGLDGLLGGTAAVEGVCLSALLLLIGQRSVAVMPLVLSAACLGFLRYNLSPARIFAGDCGSGTVGFLLGVLSLPAFIGATWSLGVLAPLLVFAYPLTDLFTAILRRISRGQSLFSADRAHLHHRITATGLSHGRCTALLLLLSASLGCVGILLSRETEAIGASLAIVSAILLMIGIRRFLLHFAQNG